MRGGTVGKPNDKQTVTGLSPRARGNPREGRADRHGRRSMPRVRGGTAPPAVRAGPSTGLSPRARGNHHQPRQNRRDIGSIPACAGEPDRRDRKAEVVGVYPRVRGGTTDATSSTHTGVGLSPRARGNPRRFVAGPCGHGSIPARAGEPSESRRLRQGWQVYPRVRGGTHRDNNYDADAEGLSPRARGNPRHDIKSGLTRGSIPACAGEPQGEPRLPVRHGVYPRVRGGT